MTKRLLVTYSIFGIGYLTFDYWPETQIKYDVLAIARNKTQLIYSGYVIYTSLQDYKYNVLPLQDPEEYRNEIRKFHVRTAERIYDLCVRSKGIYIKFGQYISTLDRVVPKEVADVLKRLQDNCPPHTLQTMKIAMTASLPNWPEYILDIDETPLGSASLAQVHKAKLVDGTQVAVKIQYPELRVQFDLDLRTLTWLAKQLGRVLNYYQIESINPEELFNKFKSSVRKEMDFYEEIKNSQRTKTFFSENDSIFVPKVFPELCSATVITMDYIEGVRIDENEIIKNKLHLDLKECGQILVDLYLLMIFDAGQIHCDPHPGNILVRKHPFYPNRPQIILLDHGFYRHLSAEVRDKFVELWMALVNKDNAKIKLIAKWFGIEKKANYLSLIFLFRTKNVRRLGDGFSPEEVNRLRNKHVLSLMNVSSLLDEFPEDILMIIRSLNLIAMRNVQLGGNQRDRLLNTTRKVYQKYYGNWVWWRVGYGIFRFKLWLYESLFFFLRKFEKTDQVLDL